jgi:Zn-dependent peptidase ImmA (M78 family)/transcriptional regulator with XRE-family HTH domain
MTVGVNGFIGERLREAREARELTTQSSLAGLLGVSNNTISLYENNSSNPRPEMVASIAELLKVKEAYFFTPLPKQTNPIFWRSTHATTKDKRTIAQARFGWMKLIDAYLKQFLEMPKLNVPDRKEIGVPACVDDITDELIEHITLQCREYWNLGKTPIQNMTAVLENNGIMVSFGSLNSDKLDAFSNESEYDCSFHIFLGTDKQSGLRSRYDAAHELGHLIMHSHLPQKVFLGKNHSFFERQAHRFASAFLMPRPSFKNDVWMTSIEALKTLRSRWNVSVGAMMKRCDDIGLYGEKDTSRMWITYRNNWRKIEDDNFVFEQPQLLKRSLEMLISENIRTKSQVLYDLPFMEKDIEEMLNLPSGFFKEDFGELKQFPTVKDEHKQRDFEFGEVIKYDFKKRA